MVIFPRECYNLQLALVYISVDMPDVKRVISVPYTLDGEDEQEVIQCHSLHTAGAREI